MRPSSTAALLAFFIGLVGILAFDALTARMDFMGALPISSVMILAQAFFFGLPTLLYFWRKPEHRPALRLHPIRLSTGLLIGLSALVGTLALSNLAEYWRFALDWMGLPLAQEIAVSPQTSVQLLHVLLAAAIAPALFEELLFRGFLLPSMEPYGPKWAIFISGILFALLHGRIEALPTHLVLGMLLSYLVLRTGSLWSAILYHGIHNAAIMIIIFFANMFPQLEQMPRGSLLVLLFAWGGLLYYALWCGDRRREARRLPRAVQATMPALSVILLAACVVLLLMTQVIALL